MASMGMYLQKKVITKGNCILNVTICVEQHHILSLKKILTNSFDPIRQKYIHKSNALRKSSRHNRTLAQFKTVRV